MKFYCHTHRSGEGGIVAGEGEAAFVYALFTFGALQRLGEFNYFRVDKCGDSPVRQRPDHKNAQQDADLGGGQTHALGIFGLYQGLLHVIDNIEDFFV